MKNKEKTDEEIISELDNIIENGISIDYDTKPKYTVKQMAKKLGLSTHTIRFYDKEHLFPFVKRDISNERIFNVSEKELKLYEKLGVKNWKDKIPTYKPELFKERDLNKLYINMLHSELVHIAIEFFSYIPFFISIFCNYLHDSILIFLFTSVFASLIDTTFIIVQRYNRPRVKHLMSLIIEKH